MFVQLAFLALLVELCIGYPDRLYRMIGHPVTWIGRLIAWADRRFNRGDSRRLAGLALVVILVILAGFAGWVVQNLVPGIAGMVLAVLAGSSLLAQRSLARHVEAVAVALEREGLEAGRRAVSMIVGRDPDRLDEAGVARAAIESLAENFSDGVVAPALWMALGGLPGAAIYKAINTADSMIGHLTPRHGAFGEAAARLDDLVNLPASRLSALLLIAGAALFPGGDPGRAARAVRRDARRHRSPNAGWPEAAMAGALGLALAGPRFYGGVETGDAIMGEGGRRAATAADIRRALALYRRASTLMLVLFGSAALALLLA